MKFIETVEATVGFYYEWKGSFDIAHSDETVYITANANTVKGLIKSIADAILQDEQKEECSRVLSFLSETVFYTKNIKFVTENGLHHSLQFEEREIISRYCFYDKVINSTYFKKHYAKIKNRFKKLKKELGK